MTKIIFVSNSEKIHLYLWECILKLAENIDNVEILFFVDKSIKSHQVTLPFIINQIDKVFNFYTKNPFENKNIIDLIKKEGNISLIKNSSELKRVDWIIFESIPNNMNTYKSLSKNGIITLDFNKNKLINRINTLPYIDLNILIYNENFINWDIAETIQLKKEIGLNNNINKILFSYSIYLAKYLKNYTKKSSVKYDSRLETFNYLSLITYYFTFLFKQLKRKAWKKQLNWKLVVQKKNKRALIDQPKNSFWADPFVINFKNNIVIFFEELKNDGKTGMISAIELAENFEILKKKEVLNEDYHFSFPNVFLFNNQYYMIPETSEHNVLQLYECNNFPYEWSFKMNLMENVKLLDTVWVYHNNLYYLFANVIEDFEIGNNERLYIFYSKDLFSTKWTPHKENPVITNAKSARNAGNFFFEKDKLCRVSQNCFDQYGENLVINEVLELSTDNYKEKILRQINPPKEYIGMHTMNRIEDITVFDYLMNE
ncbi:hypothetical protein [Mariniflexile sp.]|uniref:glucosamine inositolphosphorylceramide transferase family protein n=1 Tax=Mariniflexile sp. TaxID=1979402 RepID=UPI0035624C02